MGEDLGGSCYIQQEYSLCENAFSPRKDMRQPSPEYEKSLAHLVILYRNENDTIPSIKHVFVKLLSLGGICGQQQET